MLRSLKDLEGYEVRATDGDIGRAVDFLFDDHRWAVRYLVVATGGFFDSRSVLISPISFREADWRTRRFNLALTREKVKNSPSVDADKPVSRQYERDYHGYYDYPYYWGYPGVWGMDAYPGLLAIGDWSDAPSAKAGAGDAHLRSAEEVRGYRIQGTDEPVGHVEDFIVDDETWEVRYLVINTSSWLLGKKVLVAPHWAKSVSWSERVVHVDVSRKAIKTSPEWKPAAGVNRQYEVELYDYYGRPVYWGGDARPAVIPPLASRPVDLERR